MISAPGLGFCDQLHQVAVKSESQHDMNMTSIQYSDSFVNQPPGDNVISRVTDWIKSAFAARRARKALLQNIRYLRRLDTATLDDIGVDVHALNCSFATIARANPYVIAKETLSGSRS